MPNQLIRRDKTNRVCPLTAGCSSGQPSVHLRVKRWHWNAEVHIWSRLLRDALCQWRSWKIKIKLTNWGISAARWLTWRLTNIGQELGGVKGRELWLCDWWLASQQTPAEWTKYVQWVWNGPEMFPRCPKMAETDQYHAAAAGSNYWLGCGE